MSLKPPSEDAVAKALSILMTSMREENAQDFVLGNDNACEFLPTPELANNVDAVGLAKSCMVKRMDAFVARMQHLRNLASPIHRLPLDILSIILDGFPVWSSSPGQTSLVDLIKVDRVWYHAIGNLPHLWKIVPLDTPPKLARLVLERSRLPLTITSLSMVAMTRSEDQAVREDPTAPEGMVTMTIPTGLPEIAVGASERWKEMDFTLSCEGYEKVEQLLEASTPALEVLRVLVKYPPLSRTMDHLPCRRDLLSKSSS